MQLWNIILLRLEEHFVADFVNLDISLWYDRKAFCYANLIF